MPLSLKKNQFNQVRPSRIESSKVCSVLQVDVDARRGDGVNQASRTVIEYYLFCRVDCGYFESHDRSSLIRNSSRVGSRGSLFAERCREIEFPLKETKQKRIGDFKARCPVAPYLNIKRQMKYRSEVQFITGFDRSWYFHFIFRNVGFFHLTQCTLGDR